MEILYILAFIALVAIIFGVSMHQAFWGIIAFIVGCFILSVVVLFIEAYVDKTKKKINYLKSSKGKTEVKRKISDDISGALVVLWLFSPFLGVILVALLGQQFPEFSQKYGWLEVVLGFAPFVIGLVILIISTKKALKKNANHKN